MAILLSPRVSRCSITLWNTPYNLNTTYRDAHERTGGRASANLSSNTPRRKVYSVKLSKGKALNSRRAISGSEASFWRLASKMANACVSASMRWRSTRARAISSLEATHEATIKRREARSVVKTSFSVERS